MRFRKLPVEVEASLWNQNGDHPEDGTETFIAPGGGKEYLREGNVVRYFRHPRIPGEKPCTECAVIMDAHGWIDTREGGHVVCPGDWIVTGVEGERYPVKPSIFKKTYEAASGPSAESSDTAAGQAMRAYLETALKRGHIDHALRAEIDPANGGVKFYIHPHGKDGDTMDVNMGPRLAAA